MCDPAACALFLYVSQSASGLLMLTLSLASASHAWGRVSITLEAVDPFWFEFVCVCVFSLGLVWVLLVWLCLASGFCV